LRRRGAPAPVDVHVVETPSLLFYPRPLAHRFVSDAKVGADMACAHVEFRAGAINPIAQALPPVVVMPLAELAGAAPVLELLFAEAFAQRCGRQAVVDRLFEVVLIQILRTLMDRSTVAHGLLAGLAHPKLAKALVALHTAPARDWTLERLARAAGMSRSSFAATFHGIVGATPGDYLAGWRVALAQDALRRGRPLKLIVGDVGYGSAAALSRAFKSTTGLSPRAWQARDAA
jgi:AraC-like DNA-binding protein